MNYRNINETSEELMNLFINCPEVIELDLSNNMLSKLPLEISFLTCLTKLDIRNNAFSNVIKQIYNNILNQIQFEDTVKVLTTIKSLTELDIDLIDSNEAMLVLNNLPNVQILNGRSTKDDDDDEEEEEENVDDDLGEINAMENNERSNINSKYNNNRHDHFYPKMEEIEEYKNSENNSNYISESNHKTKTNEIEDNRDINEHNENLNINNTETENDNNYSSSKDKENLNNSKEREKKVTRNKNVLNEKEFNPKIDSNNEQNLSNVTSQNKQNTINSLKKKTESQSQNNNKSNNI